MLHLEHILHSMWELGYQSCDADPGLWIKNEYRPKNELEYHLYILCYADDIL